MLEGLDDVRAELDEVDRRIVEALVDRDRIVKEVALRKADLSGGQVRDPEREEALLTRLVSICQQAGLDGFYVTRLFREVLDHSVRLQQEHLARRSNPLRDDDAEYCVAYQGVDGAYSQLAAARHFGPRPASVRFQGYTSFKAMMEAVQTGDARYGMLPIENTTAGSINDAYDLLARIDLHVVGEEVQKVDHCLVALEPVPVSRIRRVFSHPQALAQCSNFLSGLEDCHVESFTDTAMSVQKVGAEQDLSQAAVASEEAARTYGLHVIKRDIANQKENYTRFLVVAATPEKVDPRVVSKTSLILATRHEQGALLGCLNVLAEHGLNLTKLESRPRPHTPWEYLFYVDIEGNLEDPDVAAALRQVASLTSQMRVLGSYPARTRHDARDASPSAGGLASAAAEGDATAAVAASIPASASVAQASELERLPYQLVSRRHRSADTVVRVASIEIGGDAGLVAADLGAIRDPDVALGLARTAHASGAAMLVCGVADSATQRELGRLGKDALLVAEEIGKSVGLPVVMEVEHASDVERVAERADMIRIDAVHMENEVLLRQVALVGRPVLLERGQMASIDEWLGAAEFILERGNHDVVLCARGIRTFEQATPLTMDLGGLLVVRSRSHLPVLAAPCGALGNGRWAGSLALGARQMGASGAILRLTPGSEERESVTPGELRDLAASFQPESA